jgi:uroporphyrinogen-III synthase
MADNDTRGDGRGSGATVLLTRPRAQSAGFAVQVRARLPGVRVVVAPLMEIVPTGSAPELGPRDAAIFTSANAVAAAGAGHGRLAFCVGTRTAAAAEAAGFAATVAGPTAEALVAELARLRPEGRLVHLHGVHTRGDVAARLAAAGLTVEARSVYDQINVPPGPDFAEALAAPRLVAPLFSPRSAHLFAKAARRAGVSRTSEPLRLVALSPAVRDALPPDWRAGVTVTASPDASAILDEIARRVYP